MVALFIPALLAQGQTDTGIYTYGPAHAANVNSDGTPKAIKVCTAPVNKPEQKSCDLWSFADGHYNAARPQNPPAILVLEKFDRQNIVLRLANPALPGMNR